MSLQRAVAAPYRQRGVECMKESEFVVALSLDRDWFSPDQAKRLVDVATGEGLLEHTDDGLLITLDPLSVDLPEGFHPDESILRQRTMFERLLDAIVDADIEKQTAVAEINRLQAELDISLEAAAALYGRQHGVDVSDLARRTLEELGE